MALELGSLKKAVASLERAWNFSQNRLAQKGVGPEEAEVIRAGVVQNFEFTYELCWKFMKRWLELNLTPGMMEGITRKQLFRFAAENRLIDDYDQWVLYHDLRNKTSHIYDLETANFIFEQTGMFARDAKTFLAALEARND
jgi:nucleotidyltransferase substrate binding protein (TIGR01987 family)